MYVSTHSNGFPHVLQPETWGPTAKLHSVHSTNQAVVFEGWRSFFWTVFIQTKYGVRGGVVTDNVLFDLSFLPPCTCATIKAGRCMAKSLFQLVCNVPIYMPIFNLTCFDRLLWFPHWACVESDASRVFVGCCWHDYFHAQACCRKASDVPGHTRCTCIQPKPWGE
jgi:hypothetical protein